VAVFAAADPALGTERLVVVAETRLQDEQALAALRDKITAVAASLLGTRRTRSCSLPRAAC